MSIAASAPVTAPSGPELDVLVEQPVVEDGVVEGIRADEVRRHVASDDAERMLAALHRRGLAPADDAVLGLDAHQGAAIDPADRRASNSPAELRLA